MKKYIKIMCVFVILAVTVLALVSGKDPVEADTAQNVNMGVEWTMSDNGNTLTGNGKTYTYYEVPIMSGVESKRQYFYANSVIDVDTYYSITSYDEDGEIIWINKSVSLFYATEEGRAHLDSFYSGAEREYILKRYGGEADLSNGFAERLAEYDGEKVTFNLPTLERYDEYLIDAIDTKRIISYHAASIFEINGDYYYVDHEKLDNSYFDAMGDLSFRKGKIELVKLGGDIVSEISGYIENVTYKDTEYIYENVNMNYDGVDVFALLAYIWSGIICPLAGIVVGFVLPGVKRLGRPKRWYAVAVLSILVLIITAVYLILLL